MLEKMPFNGIPFCVFFSLFLLSSIIHLVFCFLEKEKLRKITKPFCVFFLAIAVIFICPNEWLIYTGLLFGVVGDILLLKKHKVWPLVIGTFSFFVNHCLFIAEAIKLCFPINNFIYFFMALFPILFCLISYYPFKKVFRQGQLTFGGSIYCSFLALDFLMMLVLAIMYKPQFLLVSSIGGFAFIASDIFLCYTLFIKDVKRRDFFIMALYLIAQALISFGLAFTFLLSI